MRANEGSGLMRDACFVNNFCELGNQREENSSKLLGVQKKSKVKIFAVSIVDKIMIKSLIGLHKL